MPTEMVLVLCSTVSTSPITIRAILHRVGGLDQNLRAAGVEGYGEIVVQKELSPAKEVHGGRREVVLVRFGEVEIHEGLRVRPLGDRIQRQESQARIDTAARTRSVAVAVHVGGTAGPKDDGTGITISDVRARLDRGGIVCSGRCGVEGS